MDWITSYRRDPFYLLLGQVEKTLRSRACQLTMLLEEQQIPNLIVSSSIPCLTFSDLDYSEPLSTTQQRENAIWFFNGYWSSTQEHRRLRIAADNPLWEESSFKSHIHFIHDCTFHRGQCRCKFTSGIRLVQQTKHRIQTEQLSIDDYECLILYLCEEGKYLHSILLGNRHAALPNLCEMLQIRRNMGS